MDAEMMSDISEQRTSFYLDYVADWTCQVCEHVHNGMPVNYVFKTDDAFVMGYSQESLAGGNHVLWRADCVVEQHPELLPLFHLPFNIGAERIADGWKLTRIPIKDRVYDGYAVAMRSLSEFRQVETRKYFALGTKSNTHEKIFMAGARFLPLWNSADEARRSRNKNLVERLVLRVLELTVDEIVERALKDSHNYVGINQGEDTWELMIVDEKLNIPENTLRL